ncbi:MAG: hypothetical protein M1820_007347 [Bogoriella megaspora]|nr:MAG: hypothetical protein M1820_007347 [Bogoriella megaspora]
MSSNPTKDYGWEAQPRSFSKLLTSRSDKKPSTPLPPIKVADIKLPDTPLAKEVTSYARRELREETFNHSMRVYYYGNTQPSVKSLLILAPSTYKTFSLKQFTNHLHLLKPTGQAIALHHFPNFSFTPETYLLLCLLHDIGTTQKNISSTHLSFEFHGALISHSLLLSHSAPIAQAEAVAEAIIRHQDLGDSGMITTLGAIVQLATILDNAGENVELVGKEFVEEVVGAWPRKGWAACFAGTVREEIERKPWANSTRIDGFAEMVEGNEVMRPYD